MILPRKIQSGERYAATKDKINEIIDYLMSIRLVHGPGIQIRSYSNGIVIDTAAGKTQSGGGGAAEEYGGMFKVSITKTGNGTPQLSVTHGNDPLKPAGYAYYNATFVKCASRTGIAVQAGILCLCINRAENVSYEIVSSVPDMPETESQNEDLTAKYPLAEISGSEESGWTVDQLVRYTIPQLWCFGVCESAT